MAFEVHIIGSGSALPSKGRHHSAQLLKISQAQYLVDCGECTQFRLVALGHSLVKIDAIFISHLHGDHVLGLQGLLSSMDMLGRKKPLVVFSPPGLAEYCTTFFRLTQMVLHYQLKIKELQLVDKQLIFEDEKVVVFAFPLKHGVPAQGYLFQEKLAQRNLIKEKLLPAMSAEEMRLLKEGKNILTDTGKPKYLASEYTTEPPTTRSYAYCSDTVFDEQLPAYINGVDMLFHEATYLEIHKDKAIKNNHSTAKEAALIAQMAGVKKLAIGHLSSRYSDFEAHILEAQKEFANTETATEGKVFTL